MAEIDSNRLREDELVNAALTAAGISRQAGVRHSLSPAPKNAQLDLPDDEQPVDVGFEQRVKEVAEKFIADAEANGYRYTEDARMILMEKIRGNPDNYL